MLRIILIGCLTIFVALRVAAQQTADTASKRFKPVFKAGAFYNSYLHYYGRTDSLQNGAVFMLAELWLNRHFYINAAPIFITGKDRDPSYAGSVLMAGYRFGKENKATGHFYGVRPFYKPDVRLMQSALKAQLGGSGTIYRKIINVTFGADVKWSDEIDFGAQAGVDHIFRYKMKGSMVLIVDPTIFVNAGTRQFTRTYLKQSDFLLFPGPQQQVTESVKEFNILSYEISVPVVLARGKMQFIFSPAYVIPQNMVSEKGENKFYGIVGARLTL